MWRISITSADWSAERLLPIFLNEQGRSFLPTGRSLWEMLLDQEIQVDGYQDRSASNTAFEQCLSAAKSHGKGIFIELTQMHHKQLGMDREKGNYAFQIRQRMIERVGLPTVRAYRLAQLAQEQQSWTVEIERRTAIQPELTAILILNIRPKVA